MILTCCLALLFLNERLVASVNEGDSTCVTRARITAMQSRPIVGKGTSANSRKSRALLRRSSCCLSLINSEVGFRAPLLHQDVSAAVRIHHVYHLSPQNREDAR
jgi:hypothetical protein